MTSEQLSDTLRVFTAVPLDDAARRFTAAIATEASKTIEGVRWVPDENLHVTLRFIGKCSSQTVADLASTMREAARYLPATLKIGGLGGFPSEGSARVVWVGASDETGVLQKVYNVLDEGAYGRQYRPHITIGRAGRRPVGLTSYLIDDIASRGTVTMDVCELVMFKSLLMGSGARYSVIERVGR
jgi:2'-5' RNA ligase